MTDMYVSFDYLCPECGHREPRFVNRLAMDAQPCPQSMEHDELTLMLRLPAAPRTIFRFADRKLKD